MPMIRTVLPFENLTPARLFWLPSPNRLSWIATSSTRAPRNELRNARDGGVQFSIGPVALRMHHIRSQAGWTMYRAQAAGSEAVNRRAQALAVRSIFSVADSGRAGADPNFTKATWPTAGSSTLHHLATFEMSRAKMA
jgi:hypothetical protein